MLPSDYLFPSEGNKDHDFAIKQLRRRHSCYRKDGLDTHQRRDSEWAMGMLLQGMELPREKLMEAEKS